MNKKEMYDLGPKGFESAEGEDQMNSDEIYSIPNEEACSAEFSNGCITADGQAD